MWLLTSYPIFMGSFIGSFFPGEGRKKILNMDINFRCFFHCIFWAIIFQGVGGRGY